MSQATCRMLRFSRLTSSRPSLSLTCHNKQLPACGVVTTAALQRPFSGSSFLNRGKPEGKEGESEEEARRRELRTVTSGTTAQSLENDRPWHRQNSHAQPETTSPDHMVASSDKGRLLTTPTRLLKLILPMPFHPKQEHVNKPIEGGKDKNETVEPLALLVHPQQPLSYLERLIQAEIPPLRYDGRDKLPDIVFRAEADQEESYQKHGRKGDNVASYSGLGHEGPDRKNTNWVRWSGSTEVGDFIRDAARGREFAIDIEGYDKELRVAVPSFRDRTYYMRMNLRRMSREIESMAKVKSECDRIAHQGAHRLAQGGFAILTGWWGAVYYITFHTESGWDLVEPITYLVGLSAVIGGYLWFLYVSRDLSYKAAMKLTVSRRQSALYQEHGLDESKWEQLVHEANHLRRDIRMVAQEYDVDWNEIQDVGEDVKEVLEEEENKKNGKKEKPRDDDDDEDEADTATPPSSKKK